MILYYVYDFLINKYSNSPTRHDDRFLSNLSLQKSHADRETNVAES